MLANALICPHCKRPAIQLESFGRIKYECRSYIMRDRRNVTPNCGFRGRYQKDETTARLVWLKLYQEVKT